MSVATRGKRPNLLVVYPDQMRAQSMGFMDADPVHTPHLDAFAQESLILTQAVANYPVCSPSRAMMLSGKYPPGTGVIDNCYSWSAPFGCELRGSDRCWSDVCSDAGYSLGYIGKWHLDAPHAPFVDTKNNQPELAWNEWCPPDRRHGFSHWYAYGTYDWHMKPMYWRGDAGRADFEYVDQWGPEHEADKAIAYLENEGGHLRDPEAPFALVVAMNPPHPPYDMYPPDYKAPYEGKAPADLIVRPNVDLDGNSEASAFALAHTADYFANITGVDAQFGRILMALDDCGLSEDTIVLFTSDHGNCVGAHGYYGKNCPFEEAVRVPFLIRWPDRIAPRMDPLLLSIPDIAPTLLGLLGLEAGAPDGMQGASYAASFLGEGSDGPRSQLYFRIPYDAPGAGMRGVRTRRYKLNIDAGCGEPARSELYDLEHDPYELQNILLEKPDVARNLVKEELRPALARISDPWIRHLDSWEPAHLLQWPAVNPAP